QPVRAGGGGGGGFGAAVSAQVVTLGGEEGRGGAGGLILVAAPGRGAMEADQGHSKGGQQRAGDDQPDRPVGAGNGRVLGQAFVGSGRAGRGLGRGSFGGVGQLRLGRETMSHPVGDDGHQ